MNSEMVKSEMVVLTGRKKTNANVMLPESCSLLLEPQWVRGREKADVAWVRVRYNPTITGTSLRGVCLQLFVKKNY
jgi:hypothetical protein